MQYRLLVVRSLLAFTLLMLVPSVALAHHPGGAAAPSTTGSLGILRTTTGVGSHATSTFEYLRLSAVPPSYADPLGEPALDGFAHEIVLGVGLDPAIALELSLPSLVGLDAPSAFHVGDLGLAARWLAWTRAGGSLRLSLQTTFPSGDPEEGIGAGALVTIPSVDYLHRLAPGLTLATSTSLVAAWQRQGDLALAGGAALRWMFLDVLGAAFEGNVLTALRDSSLRAGPFARSPREVGDTSVVLRPWLMVQPVPSLSLAAGPQVAVTAVRDVDHGAAVIVRYQIE